ncbi:MAG: NAD-dependent dihydropyrimidine dehydrogenase subunit PreA [Candidatus Schekmanbacteria bacterium]|nr:NAD-dependent dihydropyrimidine dehydrogenase subunit PreA [Candidatus Schekmanbacteria bacterium]
MKPCLQATLCGISSPNPFWLASAPPSNSAYQVKRAFEAGWGGAVWKTIGHEPIVNVSSRYAAVDYDGRKIMGLNNIELITDRTLNDNLREIREVKRAFPDRALVVSLMVESERERWHDIVKRTQDTGCDGLELNFGCPHGMSERGMGSAVGQVPEYTERITAWVKEAARIPVLVKLTPNVTNVRAIGRAARAGGADGLSLINTINSIMGIDLDTLAPKPQVAGRGSHGGYCGPAVKPIALNLVHQIASDPQIALPVSGIGGIQAWQDAVEFLLLGSSTVQLCTAVMHYGFRLIDPLVSGLESWMAGKGFARLDDFVGRSVPRVGDWADLDLGYKIVAAIDQDACVHCGLCYIACEDGAHQSILCTAVGVDDFLAAGGAAARLVTYSGGKRAVSGGGDGVVNVYRVNQDTCVGCNLCSLVCPVHGCISMVERESAIPRMSWREYQQRLARGEVAKIAPPTHV